MYLFQQTAVCQNQNKIASVSCDTETKIPTNLRVTTLLRPFLAKRTSSGRSDLSCVLTAAADASLGFLRSMHSSRKRIQSSCRLPHTTRQLSGRLGCFYLPFDLHFCFSTLKRQSFKALKCLYYNTPKTNCQYLF